MERNFHAFKPRSHEYAHKPFGMAAVPMKILLKFVQDRRGSICVRMCWSLGSACCYANEHQCRNSWTVWKMDDAHSLQPAVPPSHASHTHLYDVHTFNKVPLFYIDQLLSTFLGHLTFCNSFLHSTQRIPIPKKNSHKSYRKKKENFTE